VLDRERAFDALFRAKNVSEFNNFYFTTGRTTMIGLRVRS